MIKTLATPQNNNFNLRIPDDYVGKNIEIIFYALDEIGQQKDMTPKKSMGDFWGKISDETAQDLQKQVEAGRNDWEPRLKNQQ